MPVRMNLYPLHTRQAVVHQYFNLNLSVSHISWLFGGHPCESTVDSIVNDYLIDGLEGLVRIGKLGSTHDSRRVNEFAANLLYELVDANEGVNLHEIASEMERRTGAEWGRAHVYRALEELGFSRVKVTSRACEADEDRRAEFVEMCAARAMTSDQLVFLDEVGSVSGQRA